MSHQHQRWVLQQLAHLGEEGGGDGTIDDAVVAAEADPHALADDDLALVIDDRGFADAADGDDGGLRWIDDSGELVDAEGSEI